MQTKKDKGGRKPPRTHQPHWKDDTITQRQQSRRAKLNEIAQAVGYSSWSAFETACLNGTAQPTQHAPDVANAFCKCVNPQWEIREECGICGKPPCA